VSIRDIKRVGAKYGGQPVTDVYSAGCYDQPMTGDYVAGRRDHEMGLIFLTHEWGGSNFLMAQVSNLRLSSLLNKVICSSSHMK